MISEEHLDDTYGIEPIIWENAKNEAREIIKNAGVREQFITYQELTQQMKAVRLEPDQTIFHRMLGQISWEEHLAGRGMFNCASYP